MIKRIINKLKRMVWGPVRRRQIARAWRAGQPLARRRDLQDLLGVPALINDPEVVALQKYASLADQSIVEIGCAYGGSSLLFLLAKRAGVRVTSIDPFVIDSMGDFQATQKLCSLHVSRALKLVGKSEIVKDWELLPDYSFNVVKSWNKPIDVLFIDGDHRYEAVKKDFEDWLPLLKAGGFIIFHDSCQPVGGSDQKYVYGWPGPSQLVRELQTNPQVSLREQVHSLSIFTKK